jgi:signal transduction histidine kinase
MPKAYFKTNVLLKNIVGKDLINDDKIAVLELVKNSYDAAAKEVDLYFRNLVPTKSGKGPPVITTKQKGDNGGIVVLKPEILIVDDGSGMTQSDVLQKWLNIAFSKKKYEPKKGRRVMAGNKGVGRFSCDRLGEQLDLYTRTQGGDVIHLSVDWTKFEIENKPNLVIQKIPVTLEKSNLEHVRTTTELPDWSKGTILHIQGLRSAWGKDAILKLRAYLERLFNPNQAFEIEKFKLEIIAPDFAAYDLDARENEKINGPVQNEIFEKLNFKTTNIESTIDEDGKLITTVLNHDGKEVYRVVEKNESPQLKSVKVVIYYLNPYKKTYFRKQTGLDSVEFGSIFLFINGFRIPPYGDRGNDWLGLDVRKTQGTSRYIGTRDVVGRIEINDLDNRFQVISSREGIVKNQAATQLDPFYKRAHLRLENFVVQGLGWDSVPEYIRKQLRSDGTFKWNEKTEEYVESDSQKASRIGENLLSILDSKPESVVRLTINPQLLDQVSSQHRETVNRILSHFEEYDSGVVDSKLRNALKKLRDVVDRQDRELAKLQKNLAEKESKIEDLTSEAQTREREVLFLKSISTLDQDNLVNMLHQVGLDSSTIKNNVERLLNMIARHETIGKDFLANTLEGISLANKKVLAISQFATKANFKLQSKPIQADLVSFIRQYLLNVARDYVAAGLKLTVDDGRAGQFEIKLKPIEVSIVFDNLLSNAKKAGAKEIVVSMDRVAENELRVVVTDKGRGFSPQIKKLEDIFRRGFTTTTGSGLGLYHVSTILKSMNGTISAAAGPEGKGAQFTIDIKK